MQLTKEDKKFLINLNLYNRGYVTNAASIIMSSCLSFSAIILALFSMYLSVTGLNFAALIPAVVIVVSLGTYWVWSMKQYKKMIRNSRKFNDQYQKYYFDLYYDKREKKLY